MFELRVNGEPVWRSERQVTQVSMMTDRGEAGRAGVDLATGVVDIVVTEVSPSGPMRLDQLENLERQQNAERMSSEGASQGFVSPENYQPQSDANKPGQGNPTYLTDPSSNPAPGSLISGGGVSDSASGSIAGDGTDAQQVTPTVQPNNTLTSAPDPDQGGEELQPETFNPEGTSNSVSNPPTEQPTNAGEGGIDLGLTGTGQEPTTTGNEVVTPSESGEQAGAISEPPNTGTTP